MLSRPLASPLEPEGSLVQTPLPMLLHALYQGERTCTLVLREAGIEKRIVIEDGAPVACESNLLGDGLGPFLVSRKRLSEEQFQLVQAECGRTGARFDALLIERQILPSLELYKELRALLAMKILDCFKWSQGSYQILTSAERSDSAIRMNMLQLILQGTKQFLPQDVISGLLAGKGAPRFVRSAHPPDETASLRLSTQDAKLIEQLEVENSSAEIAERCGVDAPTALRQLIALAFVGYVELRHSSAPGEVTGPAPAAVSQELATENRTTAIAESSGYAEGDSLEAAQGDEVPSDAAAAQAALENELTTALLEHRHKDPFDLLQVDVDATGPMVRKAFLWLIDRYSPARFWSDDARDRAGELMIAYARAYFALNDPDKRSHLRRRRHQEPAPVAQPPANVPERRKSPEEARKWFAEGREFLDAGNLWGALEAFKAANELDPHPLSRGYFSYTRFQLNPRLHADAAIRDLTAAIKASNQDHRIHFFLGEVHRSRSDWQNAHDCFRAAQERQPSEPRYEVLRREMAKHFTTSKGFIGRLFHRA